MKPSEFIGTLFLARDVTHGSHLSTDSYAEHQALGDFYPAVIELADSFAETYQGKFGLIKGIPLMTMKQTKDVVEFLEGQMQEIEECRFDICPKECTFLQNIIDEIIALYSRTLYKLKNLK